MDLIKINCTEVDLDRNEEMDILASVDQVLSPVSSNADGIHEDSEMHPRLGEKYQAEVPPLMKESEYFLRSQNDSGLTSGANADIEFGLPIPIIWVQHAVHDLIKCEEYEYGKTTTPVLLCGSLSDLKCKDVSNDHESNKSSSTTEDSGKHTTSTPITTSCDALPAEGLFVPRSKSIDCIKRECRTIDMDIGGSVTLLNKVNGFTPLPCTSAAPWTPEEVQSFLLGLYIFGKNLVNLRNFMETKEMGEILSFYYGKFYRTGEYRRWSECRKMRSKRCVLGQRIFTGWRQQELLSRLLAGLSKEFQDAVVEVFRGFNEDKTAFVEFISSLKAVVHMKVLVAAVGIGKRKHDLTGIVSGPSRTNQVSSVHSGVLIGKACSTLTTGDVVKILTGNFRLSKARSNDIFWDAVWPRLLARGWHSEQPRQLSSAVGFKNSLVFLVPGIKKFSRRKLVKGDHYFDSISDVLNKVASDPGLLEPELEGIEGKGDIRDNCGQQVSNQNGSLDNRRNHSSTVPPCASDGMKFTVVDTSLVEDGRPSTARSLRTLPTTDAPRSCSTSRSGTSGESDSESLSEPSSPEIKELENDVGMQVSGNGPQPSDLRDYLDSVSNRNMPAENYFHDEHQEMDRESRLHDGREDRKAVAMPSEANCFPHLFGGHPSKRTKTNDDRFHRGDDRPSKRANQGSTRHERIPHGTKENIPSGAEVHEGDIPMQTSFDLNLPYLPPPDFKAEETFCMDMTVSQDGSYPKELSFPSNHEPGGGSQTSETSSGFLNMPQLSTNSLRQGTRNRPLTTKILEALASGYLSTSTRQRGRGSRAKPSSSVTSRSSE